MGVTSSSPYESKDSGYSFSVQLEIDKNGKEYIEIKKIYNNNKLNYYIRKWIRKKIGLKKRVILVQKIYRGWIMRKKVFSKIKRIISIQRFFRYWNQQKKSKNNGDNKWISVLFRGKKKQNKSSIIVTPNYLSSSLPTKQISGHSNKFYREHWCRFGDNCNQASKCKFKHPNMVGVNRFPKEHEKCPSCLVYKGKCTCSYDLLI